MSADLLKFNTEAKGFECTPEGVADAVVRLWASSKDAKNALAACNANIQKETEGKRISGAYMEALEGNIGRDQEKLSKLLWLSSVSKALEEKSAAQARQSLHEEAQARAAANRRVAMEQAAQARRAAAEPKVQTAEADIQRPNNYYVDALRKVFGSKKENK